MAMPDVQFAPTDPQPIETAIIAGFEAAARLAGMSDFRLFPGDPRRLFLESIAFLIIQLNALIDKTGKGNLLRYAENDTVEDLGYLYGKRGDRLQSGKSRTTIKFKLSAVRPSVTTIQQGTRLSVGNLAFATVENLDIAAGELYGTVVAECDTPGVVGNGFLPGQISTLIDRGPFVDAAENITESAGGTDFEDLKAYKERLRILPESFSTAGPFAAYEFWAKTASALIIDVAVWSPEPGHVNVVPLMADGEAPAPEIISEINIMVSDKTRRPLTDYVHIILPEPIDYSINITYWIDEDDEAQSLQIQMAVEAAVNEYILWQRQKLGRDINPSVLTTFVMNAGARRVEVVSPEFTILTKGEVANNLSMTANFGGLEHD